MKNEKTLISISSLLHSDARENKLIAGTDKEKEAAAGLKDNISKHGLISPITVKRVIVNELEKYLVLSGNQRSWCCEALGWAEIPAYIIETNDNLAIESSANYHSIPQNKKEYANSIKLAMSTGKTIAQIAKDWAIDIRTVEAWANVNSLPEELRTKVVSGELPMVSVNSVMKSNLLTPEEKLTLVSGMDKDTTREQADKIKKDFIEKKKTAGVVSAIKGEPVKIEKKLFVSNERAILLLETVKMLETTGRDDASFIMARDVINYIFSVSNDNPLA